MPQEKDKWSRQPDWWAAIFAGLLFLVGLGTALVLICQLQVFDAQLAESQKQTQAVYTQMRQEQRSWIEVIKGPIKVAINAPIETAVHFKNIGKTPALNIIAEFVVETWENGREIDFSQGEGSRMTGGILFPDDAPLDLPLLGSELRISEPSPVPAVLSRQEFQELREGKRFIVVWGNVTYLDGFGVSHWTHYCGWSWLTTNGSSFTAAGCPAYNAVDHNP